MILLLCGQFLGAESLFTDQEASRSYRNAPHPLHVILSALFSRFWRGSTPVLMTPLREPREHTLLI